MTDCEDGLRAQVFFPSCWDGKNLDSPDHKSHMKHLSRNQDGDCPASHPVQMISLFYEVTWDIHSLKYLWQDQGQPKLVWSNGNPTGMGFHGDFLNGWDIQVLQSAITDCTNDSGRVEDCRHFKLSKDGYSKQCAASYNGDGKEHIQLLGTLTHVPNMIYEPNLASLLKIQIASLIGLISFCLFLVAS